MFKNIVVPIDFSEISSQTAIKAIEIAKTYGATLHFMHVIEPSETIPYPIHIELESYRELAQESARKNMDGFIKELNCGELTCTNSIEYGIPHQAVNDYTEKNNVDLIMIAPHGKSGLEKFFMGSVTERMVRSSSCNVLVVR